MKLDKWLIIFLIPGLSFLGYLASYAYMWGFYDFFNIPAWMVPIDIQYVMVGIATVGGIFFLMFLVLTTCARLLSALFGQKSQNVLFFLLVLVIIFLLFVTARYNFNLEFISLVSTRYLLLIAISFPFIILFVFFDIAKSYYNYLLFSLLALIIMLVSGLAGNYLIRSSEFYTTYTEGKNTYVVIRVTNGFMAVLVNTNTHRLERTMQFLPISQQYTFKSQKLGKLETVLTP